jgi:pimeloyl-ACP methyl ester carboxylesterase
VEIPGAEGLILSAVFYPALNAPSPGVLLLHMYGGSKSDWEEFARHLQGAGIAALAIDLRGHGQTGGTEDWALAREDVASACAWLADREGVDGEHIGVVGASIGANLALVLGAQDPSVDAIALLSPGFDYFRVVIQGLIEEYGERPSFLAASDEDAYSAETVRALAGSAPGEAELVLYQGAGHGTAMLQSEPELTDRLIAFLVHWLRPTG